jgi:chromosome partitioning protein
MATPIVLVSSPKGGVGKSTIVKNMAVCAAQAHLRVLAVDLDPQRTLALWGERRPKTEVVQVEVLSSTYDEWSQSKRRFSAASYSYCVINSLPATGTLHL